MAAKTTGTGTQANTETAGSTQGTGAQGDAGKTGNTQHTGTAGATGEGKTGDGTTGAAGTTADGTQGSQTGKAGEQAAQPKAPEKYELKLPEGGRIKDVHRRNVETMARANDWTNDEAQAAIEELDTQIKAQADSFLADTTKDKDYGGDNLATTQRLSKLVIDKVRPVGHPRREAFLDLLNASGYGNHIDVASFFADLGKMMGEDTATGQGSRGGGGGESTADVLYDNPTSRKLAGKT